MRRKPATISPRWRACSPITSSTCMLAEPSTARTAFAEPTEKAPGRNSGGARQIGAYIVIASLVHFLTNEVIAAPCRLLSLACPSQDVLSHFVMKLVLAAPASFLSVACVMQASSA